jgi:hypothetical protein
LHIIFPASFFCRSTVPFCVIVLFTLAMSIIFIYDFFSTAPSSLLEAPFTRTRTCISWHMHNLHIHVMYVMLCAKDVCKE